MAASRHPEWPGRVQRGSRRPSKRASEQAADWAPLHFVAEIPQTAADSGRTQDEQQQQRQRLQYATAALR